MDTDNDGDGGDVEIVSLKSSDDDLPTSVNDGRTDADQSKLRETPVKETEIINLDDCSDGKESPSYEGSGSECKESEPERRKSRKAGVVQNSESEVKNFQKTSINEVKDLPASNSSKQESIHEVHKERNSNESHENKEKKDLIALVDNQVQCVNLHCQSGYDLAEAPVFVLTYFGVTRRKNVFQKVCRECFDIALKHQESLCRLLKENQPLFGADFPSHKDDVVVVDSVDEIYEEELLPDTVVSMVEEQLMGLLEDSLKTYNIDSQIEAAQDMLADKYESLALSNKRITDELSALDDQLKNARSLIYKSFTPRIQHLKPLHIVEEHQKRSVDRNLPVKPSPTKTTAAAADSSNSLESHDVVALKEVESPKVKLPPIGKLQYPMICVGTPVYVCKTTILGIWIKAKVIEFLTQANDGSTTIRVRLESLYRVGTTKTVTGKQMAYRKPSRVRYPVGTRVIALFQHSDAPGKSNYYAGVIAEPPKVLNKFRYLVFFDDGYAQYVTHERILLVCESSRFVHEDVHPDSRDFIKSYLDQYPERPMVKLQQGQVVKTEWNGKWWSARVLVVDGSLVQMHFDADNRTEWIYRGSTRLGPLYSELVAAAARKEQGALSRHRSLGIASLKKRNMPYVEYSVDQDDAKSPQTPTVSKNVAKKSTTRASAQSDGSSDKPKGPPKPNEKIEYTTKGYVRPMEVPDRIRGRSFAPHQCGPACIEWTKFSRKDCKGLSPLAIPIKYGFERQVAKYKSKKAVMYRGPCGRRLRTILETHRYLRLTKTKMGLDCFDFDPGVRILDEFHLESNMYCTHVKDISYGHENTPVSCVNEINHSWPSFMDYSTSRIPQEGVNICLDEEFLVCCSCTDDCLDREKCECWQLTIEGTKLGPGGQVDPTAGYQYKRLLEPVTTGIYECNQRCKCAATCLNRVAQHPLQLNLQVFRTLRKGWGLRTLNDIPQGGFICIYAGRLHTEQSANDGGRMYGDEYLAELDYIEVVERFKEGYEDEVVEPYGENDDSRREEEDEGQDELDESLTNSDDRDYVPQGFKKLPEMENVVNTRGRNKKATAEESEGEKEKEEETDKESLNADDDDDDEMKKKPSKFTAAVTVAEETQTKYKSVRELFGDGADDCYIMDAKSSGNIGRYLNHSCQPNVFVQNVFVDTHDVRFPWVAFFALTHIKAGTELTWDYNYDVGSVPDKVLYCYCNSVDCRGRLL